MPDFDKTGPNGDGPITGRGMGLRDSDDKKKKKKSLMNMSAKELQELLTSFTKKIPFLRQAATGLEKSRKRIEGKEED